MSAGHATSGRRAVFLDRDGVILEEGGFVLSSTDLRIVARAPHVLARLQAAGLELVVVTNQAAVARGLVGEDQIESIHAELAARVEAASGARIAGFYVCPHHPNAAVPGYRVVCDCRKPRPGLILKAADELGLDAAASFVVGDRLTDIAAGAAAGCTTVLVRTGAHLEPPIELVEPLEADLEADFVCDDLDAAAAWILERV